MSNGKKKLAPNHHLPLIFSSLYIVKLPFLHSFEIGSKFDFNSNFLKQGSSLCTGVRWEGYQDFTTKRTESVDDFFVNEGVGWGGWFGANFSFRLTNFFDIQFKNTSNLIFLDFKVPSERFFHKDFKTGLTF